MKKKKKQQKHDENVFGPEGALQSEKNQKVVSNRRGNDSLKLREPLKQWNGGGLSLEESDRVGKMESSCLGQDHDLELCGEKKQHY